MSQDLQFLYEIPSIVTDIDYHHKPNIVNAAASIIKTLIEYDEVVTIAQMQSGKTEVMKRVIYLIKKYNEKIKEIGINIDKYNISLIICASSLSLKRQHKKKLPEISDKIYHLNDLNSFVQKPYEYTTVLDTMSDSSLIIFDECHCDVEQKKIIDRFRTLLDIRSKENDTIYHKIGFSATPYEQIIARYPKVIMEPGDNYYGIVDMFHSWKSSELAKGKSPIIFQSKKLSDPKECHEFFNEVDFLDYFYLIRLPSKKIFEDATIDNITMIFKQNQIKFDSFIYDMSYCGDINDLLIKKPLKPTLIYLKNKLRMGCYLNTKYVHVVHDDPTNAYTHTTVQSLIGRCCGYNKRKHETIIYCDYEKAYQHYKWILSNYSIKHIPADAKYIQKSTTKTKDICIY